MRPKLLAAYRKTSYEIGDLRIRIGQRSPGLDRLLLAHAARAGIFITAFNPLSRLMPPGWNQRMQARLMQRLRRRSVLRARGSLRRWTEAHLLVFGDVRPLQRLARQFRQYAIVIVRLHQVARLVATF